MLTLDYRSDWMEPHGEENQAQGGPSYNLGAAGPSAGHLSLAGRSSFQPSDRTIKVQWLS